MSPAKAKKLGFTYSPSILDYYDPYRRCAVVYLVVIYLAGDNLVTDLRASLLLSEALIRVDHVSCSH